MTTEQMVFNIANIEKIKSEFNRILELNVNFNKDIKISTMTLEAKLNTRFFPGNIFHYIKKSEGNILGVVKENRTKTEKKKKKEKNTAEFLNTKTNTINNKKSKNKQSDVFLNQVTVSIKVCNKENPVSVKIFNSGTIHFTGCVCVDNLLEAAHKLCIECRREVAVIDKDGKIKDILFAENVNELCVEKLYDFKIDMINCICTVPFNINRQKLQAMLKNDGYNASYDSNGHAGVKIKYTSV